MLTIQSFQKIIRTIFFVCVLLFISTVFLSLKGSSLDRAKTTFYLEKSYVSYKLSDVRGKSLTAAVTSFIPNYSVNYLNVAEATTTASFVPVLVYHRLTDEAEEGNVSQQVFEDHMRTLKANGWNTVTTDDLYQFLRGEKTLPAKSFILTFDDGARLSYYPVDPLLKLIDYNAVMFMLPKFSLLTKTGYYISRNDLMQMRNSGRWEIEGHGYDSHIFIKLNSSGDTGTFFGHAQWIDEENRAEEVNEYQDRVKYELATTKARIDNGLGLNVEAFAFPFGDFGQHIGRYSYAESILKYESSRIYKLLFAQIEADTKDLVEMWDEDSYLVRRLKVQPNWNGEKLLQVMNSPEDMMRGVKESAEIQ